MRVKEVCYRRASSGSADFDGGTYSLADRESTDHGRMASTTLTNAGLMIVEFAGLPGSGKSTTVRSLATELPGARNAGLRKLGRRDLLEHPVVVGRELVRWRGTRRQWADKRAATRVLRRRISQDLVSGQGADVVLLEEGITQYIWRSLFLFPELWHEPWVRMLEVEYPLIVLDARPSILSSRILQKEGNAGQINNLLGGLSSGSAEWAQATWLFERTLTYAARYRRIVRVDATGDPLATLERARDSILSIG